MEKLAPRFDLVPPILLEKVAERFALGAAKYGKNNYQKSLSNPDYLLEQANHAIAHLLTYVYPDKLGNGESKSDNLAAVGWAVAVLLEAERLKENK